MKIRKILLINPHEVYTKGIDEFRIGMPIGLASISAALKQNGHIVEFIDCSAENPRYEINIKKNTYMAGISEKQLKDKISSFNPDIVGISCNKTPQHYALELISKVVKEVNSAIVIVAGGAHAFGNSEYILRNLPVDYICRGEGESFFPDFIKFLEGETHFEKVTGGARILDGKYINNNINKILDLNSIPDPDYNIFKIELYNNERFYTRTIRGDFIADYIFSRGCHGACDFCVTSGFEGSRIRTLDLLKIENQLIKLKKTGYNELILNDNNLAGIQDKSTQVFDLLSKYGFYWTIGNGLTIHISNNDFIDSVIENGVNRVAIPIESVNDATYKYKKLWKSQPDYKYIEKAIKKLCFAGIEIEGGFMIGFPNETKEDIQNTIDYAKHLKESCGLSIALFFIFTPFKGTRLFNYCKKNNLIDDPLEWEKYTYTNGNISTENWTAEWLVEKRQQASIEVNGLEYYQDLFEKAHRPIIRPQKIEAVACS